MFVGEREENQLPAHDSIDAFLPGPRHEALVMNHRPIAVQRYQVGKAVLLEP